MRFLPFILLSLAILIHAHDGRAEKGDMFLHEDFRDLDNWQPLYFPKIREHSRYAVDTEGESSYLKAESNASASAIVFKKEFDVFQFPKVRWRWKVSNIFEKGNAKEKSGDDYPLRVYIIFKYDPQNATFAQKIKYGLAKKIYGEYPPHSSLSYIWANRKHDESIIINAYANESKMIPLQTGTENVGQWIEQSINIIDDYHKAFGEDPPAIGSLAIMSDSDNTKDNALAYIDYIEVYR